MYVLGSWPSSGTRCLCLPNLDFLVTGSVNNNTFLWFRSYSIYDSLLQQNGLKHLPRGQMASPPTLWAASKPQLAPHSAHSPAICPSALPRLSRPLIPRLCLQCDFYLATLTKQPGLQSGLCVLQGQQPVYVYWLKDTTAGRACIFPEDTVKGSHRHVCALPLILGYHSPESTGLAELKRKKGHYRKASTCLHILLCLSLALCPLVSQDHGWVLISSPISWR